MNECLNENQSKQEDQIVKILVGVKTVIIFKHFKMDIMTKNNGKLKRVKPISFLTKKIIHKVREPPQKISKPKKIVIGKLPPDMTLPIFINQVSPLPPYEYLYFVKADREYGKNAFSKAYINFIYNKDLHIFKEKFDDYVFLSSKGVEYPAIVDYAPFFKIPSKRKQHNNLHNNNNNYYYYKQLIESVGNLENDGQEPLNNMDSGGNSPPLL